MGPQKPQKPGLTETILSGPLPIFIEYKSSRGDFTGTALWRMCMCAAFRHRDRVREITFAGQGVTGVSGDR